MLSELRPFQRRGVGLKTSIHTLRTSEKGVLDSEQSLVLVAMSNSSVSTRGEMSGVLNNIQSIILA